MAQNALLKELEEPPAYAFFILTAEQPDSLLQTVRSRCTKFALEPSQGGVGRGSGNPACTLSLCGCRTARGPHDAQCNGSGKRRRAALPQACSAFCRPLSGTRFSSRRLCRKSRCSLHSASRRRHSPAPSVWNVCWRSTILLMC
ncbi:MAG: hypothetical protein ACLRVN_00795 [Butyricicoccus sp.]